MRTIPLTRGYVALVDDDDYERVAAFRWCVDIKEEKGKKQIRYYAQRVQVLPGTGGKKIKIYMHRFILGSDCPPKIDHHDTNGLNNQRYNLRPVTKSQNAANSRKMPGKTSIYKGVCWSKRRSLWQAYIMKDYVKYRLGFFREEFDAAQAYNFKAEELFGPFARFNIPAGVLV